MKRIAISILICAICARANATTPYPPKVFANDSWAFVAGFAWPDENHKVLVIRTVRKTSLLTLDELGITPHEWSTAGSGWYQNSIGYVTSLRIKDMDSEARLRVFYFRNKDGKESVIDLNTSTLIEPTTILNKNDLGKKTISNAVSLLKSGRPQDRQTAAIHLGQLGASEHLPELTKLLKDKAAYTQTSGKVTKTVYYVKEAAEKAIQLIKSKNTANNRMEKRLR
ncbi:hypothetical protein ACFLS1_12755 [Verrucomicrobiota bacterium]